MRKMDNLVVFQLDTSLLYIGEEAFSSIAQALKAAPSSSGCKAPDDMLVIGMALPVTDEERIGICLLFLFCERLPRKIIDGVHRHLD